MGEGNISSQEATLEIDDLFADLCGACEHGEYCERTEADHNQYTGEGSGGDEELQNFILEHLGQDGEIQYDADGKPVWVEASPPSAEAAPKLDQEILNQVQMNTTEGQSTFEGQEPQDNSSTFEIEGLYETSPSDLEGEPSPDGEQPRSQDEDEQPGLSDVSDMEHGFSAAAELKMVDGKLDLVFKDGDGNESHLLRDYIEDNVEPDQSISLEVFQAMIMELAANGEAEIEVYNSEGELLHIVQYFLKEDMSVIVEMWKPAKEDRDPDRADENIEEPLNDPKAETTTKIGDPTPDQIAATTGISLVPQREMTKEAANDEAKDTGTTWLLKFLGKTTVANEDIQPLNQDQISDKNLSLDTKANSSATIETTILPSVEQNQEFRQVIEEQEIKNEAEKDIVEKAPEAQSRSALYNSEQDIGVALNNEARIGGKTEQKSEAVTKTSQPGITVEKNTNRGGASQQRNEVSSIITNEPPKSGPDQPNEPQPFLNPDSRQDFQREFVQNLNNDNDTETKANIIIDTHEVIEPVAEEPTEGLPEVLEFINDSIEPRLAAEIPAVIEQKMAEIKVSEPEKVEAPQDEIVIDDNPTGIERLIALEESQFQTEPLRVVELKGNVRELQPEEPPTRASNIERARTTLELIRGLGEARQGQGQSSARQSTSAQNQQNTPTASIPPSMRSRYPTRRTEERKIAA